MSDPPIAGEATGGLVPSGVHTARRQAGKWVGALTNPPQMREHPEGTPASPPPPANTQSRTQPEAQASRGGGGRGETGVKGDTLDEIHEHHCRCPRTEAQETRSARTGSLPTNHPSCAPAGPLVSDINLLTWHPPLRANIKWCSRRYQRNKAGSAL